MVYQNFLAFELIEQFVDLDDAIAYYSDFAKGRLALISIVHHFFVLVKVKAWNEEPPKADLIGATSRTKRHTNLVEAIKNNGVSFLLRSLADFSESRGCLSYFASI